MTTLQRQHLRLPRSIFPQIPYELLLATGDSNLDYHINFVTLAMFAGTMDDVYKHFESIFSERMISNDHASMDRLNNDLCVLVECYGQFYPKWYQLTFGTWCYYIENLDHVNYLFKSPDSYLLEVCTRVPDHTSPIPTRR